MDLSNSNQAPEPPKEVQDSAATLATPDGGETQEKKENTPPQNSSACARLLRPDDYEKLKATEQKLSKLNQTVKIWVKDGMPIESPEGNREPFLLSIPETIPVEALQELIEERYRDKKLWDPATDGPLRLTFRGKTLQRGHLFQEYNQQANKTKWAKPYAGIVWTLPFRVEVGRRREEYGRVTPQLKMENPAIGTAYKKLGLSPQKRK